MRRWIGERPWIWVLLLFGAMILFNLVLVVVAGVDPPAPA